MELHELCWTTIPSPTNGQKHILSARKLPELASLQDVNRAVWLTGSLLNQAPKWLEREKRSLQLLLGNIILSKKGITTPPPPGGQQRYSVRAKSPRAPVFLDFQFSLLAEQFQRTFVSRSRWEYTLTPRWLAGI